MGALDDQFRDRILAVFSSWAEYIASCLEEAKRHGDLPKELNVPEMAKFFWFAWEGAILQAKLERSTAPIEQFRSVIFRAMGGGTQSE